MVLIALGANLPGPGGISPLETCRRAAAMLDGVADGTQTGRLKALSRWFVTAPVPVSDQPPYINGAALVTFPAPVDAAGLLVRLQAIEAACGRQRSVPNAARTLDLDLIAIDGPQGAAIRFAPDPILPHPRAHQRAFVLAPIAEIAPGWRHPILDATAAQLLQRLGDQDIRPL